MVDLFFLAALALAVALIALAVRSERTVSADAVRRTRNDRNDELRNALIRAARRN